MYTIYQYVDMCINVYVYKCVYRCTQYGKQATLELPHGLHIICLCVRVNVHAYKNVSAYEYVYKCLCI